MGVEGEDGEEGLGWVRVEERGLAGEEKGKEVGLEIQEEMGGGGGGWGQCKRVVNNNTGDCDVLVSLCISNSKRKVVAP